MKRPVVTAALLGMVASIAFAGSWVIQVDLPRPHGPARAEVALFGRGLCMQAVPAGRSAVRLDVDKLAAGCMLGHDIRPISDVKVLVIADGHAIAALEASEDSISRFRPALPRLHRATIRGWVDPPPLVPLRLSFNYSLIEAMQHFGYTDGSVPILTLGTTTTDAAGSFTIDLPDLTADSFIDQERSVDVWLEPTDKTDPYPPPADLQLQLTIHELYSGTRIILRPDRDWLPDALPRTSAGRSPGSGR